MNILICFIFSFIALTVQAQIPVMDSKQQEKLLKVLEDTHAKAVVSRLSCVNSHLTHTQTSAGGIPVQDTIWATKDGKSAPIECELDKNGQIDKYSVFGKLLELDEVITIASKQIK